MSGVVPPTAPVMITVPPVPPLRDRAWPPLTVFESVIFPPAGLAPPLVVSKVTPAVRATTPVREIGCPRVVMPAPRVIVPALPEPAVIESETPEAMVNALLTVIELAAFCCAQRATFEAAACIVATEIVTLPPVAQLGDEPCAIVPAPDVAIVIEAGSSNQSPKAPMGADVLTYPNSTPRFSFPDVSTNPPFPPSAPPRA